MGFSLQSQTKVWVTTLFLCFLSLLGALLLAGRPGLFITLALLLWGALGLYFFSRRDENLLTEFYRGRKLHLQTPGPLSARLSGFCHEQGLPRPQIFLLETQDLISASWVNLLGQPKMAIASSVLSQLDPEEVDAVLFQQILAQKNWSRVRARVFLLPVQALWGWIGFFETRFQVSGYFVLRRFLDSAIQVWLDIFLPKSLFYQVDQEAAQVLADKRHLASALWKVEGYWARQPKALPAFVSCHLLTPSQRSYLSSQPKLEPRLRRLIGYYPI